MFKLFYKIEVEENFPTSFYEATVTPITRPHIESRKRITDQFLINVDSKILNKMLTNQS